MLFFKKRPNTILTDEDKKELSQLERNAYMEEAKNLVVARGKFRAKQELEIKQKKERDY